LSYGCSVVVFFFPDVLGGSSRVICVTTWDTLGGFVL